MKIEIKVYVSIEDNMGNAHAWLNAGRVVEDVLQLNLPDVKDAWIDYDTWSVVALIKTDKLKDLNKKVMLCSSTLKGYLKTINK
jgi:hypothetical protein